MSPDNARVLVVEDDPDLREAIQGTLEKGGHNVVAVASTRDQAIALISSRLKIDVATLDGNLHDEIYDGEDGQVVLAVIRANRPEVKIVGVSSDGVPGADVNVSKFDIHKDLSQAVKDV